MDRDIDLVANQETPLDEIVGHKRFYQAIVSRKLSLAPASKSF